MSVDALKRLKVWVRAKDFALKIYKQVLPSLPPDEKWNLNQQLRRASVSISANIAEGYGRFYYRDNVRFCYTARGSLEEVLSHLVIAHAMGCIEAELYQELEREGEEISKMLHAYIAHLKSSKQGANEPGEHLALREELSPYHTEVLEDAMDSGHTNRQSSIHPVI